MAGGLADGLFQAFLNWLYSSGEITVPSDFHLQCTAINEMLNNDISGVINTVLEYSISSASNTQYRIECENNSIEELLNLWLEKINLNIKNIPTGLQELSKEYFRERWTGSSLCSLRIKGWEKISTDGNEIEIPTVMWYVNGSSIYVKRENEKNYKLGSDKYYLDEHYKEEIPQKNEEMTIQKPYDRWFTKYPTPYLIKRGVYKNWLAMKVLQDKSDEVISKILPYLFVIKRGSAELARQNINIEDEDLKTIVENLKTELEKYKFQKAKTPTTGQTYDTEFEHLIPDLRNIVSEELYRHGFRSILAGLGMIELIPVTGQSRQQSMLNPKLLIEEVNNGVNGFKSMLMEVIRLTIERNRKAHRKLFSKNNKIIIVNSPLKINTEQILDALRSGYDRGPMSIRSYQEVLGLDPQTEKERRQKELNEGLEDLFYPHLIQNREDVPDRLIPSKPKNEKNEDQNKKKGTPETKTKTAELEEDLEIAPYKNVEELIKKHPYMKKYPKGALEVFIKVFNESLPKGEDYAFPVAYTAMKRWLKKHGYKKVNDKWVKSEEEINNE